jgi:hypothetical protein
MFKAQDIDYLLSGRFFTWGLPSPNPGWDDQQGEITQGNTKHPLILYDNRLDSSCQETKSRFHCMFIILPFSLLVNWVILWPVHTRYMLVSKVMTLQKMTTLQKVTTLQNVLRLHFRERVSKYTFLEPGVFQWSFGSWHIFDFPW